MRGEHVESRDWTGWWASHEPKPALRAHYEAYNLDMISEKLCLTLCDLMDCIVHGILQSMESSRILEWAAFHFSRGSSQPRD